MTMESYPTELLVVSAAAMMAPILAEMPKHFRIPVVVAELVLGAAIGPHGLELATSDGLVATLSALGLAFLLFMVGLEIDFDKIKGRPLELGLKGWGVSLIAALLLMTFFNVIGLIQAPPLLAGVALSTTALGIVVPILRDRGELNTPFGTYLAAAGAAGEFGPLMVISVAFIPTQGTVIHALLMILFIIAAFAAVYIALRARPSRLIEILQQTMQSSGQLPVRLCILIQILFVALSEEFGLNIVIGAFTAGIVVNLAVQGTRDDILRDKLDAIGYGFVIPVFFIVAGMRFDVSTLWSEPMAPVQIVLLSGLLILIRGAPLFFYRGVIAPEEQIPFALYSATGLPLIVIISEIGVDSGYMPVNRASILVSAGMLSVIVFPLLASRLKGKRIMPW